MQESSQTPTEKRGREENPGDSENPVDKKILKKEPLAMMWNNVSLHAVQTLLPLYLEKAILVHDDSSFASAMARISPKVPFVQHALGTVWDGVDWDAQMELVTLKANEDITVNDQPRFIRAMEIIAPSNLTPENSPIIPDAPKKPEVFPVPYADDDEAPTARRRLNLGADEDDAQDEEGLTQLDLIDANTIDVTEGYNVNEPNPIKRAFMLATDALIKNSNCMFEDSRDLICALESVAAALIGEGTLKNYKLRVQAIGEGW